MTLNTDWKKQAAAVVDDGQIEKAFADQAVGYIAHKARAIMQAPYRLGFEVVYKNEDNTRMVGIFAFRIGKDLYYAPVFFLNGDIKGTDLFYRHTTKTFVPLTAEWVQHLLDSDVSVMGRPVSRQFSMNIPQYMNLGRLIRPDYGTKSASENAAADKLLWEEFFKEASAPKTVAPVLKDFITADGGVSSLALLTNAMEASIKFANALYTLLPEDAYMPEISVTEKKAAFSAKPTVILHREFGPAVKVASEDFYQKGYWFEDMRKSAAIVYEEPGEMQSISEPGIYEVSVKGGGVIKCFAARHTDEFLCERAPDYLSNYQKTTSWQLVNLDTKELLQDWTRPIMAFPEREDEKEGGEFPCCKKDVETGKAYVIFDTGSGVLSEPFKVVGRKTVDDLIKIDVLREYHSTPVCLTINPDYQRVRLADGVIGTSARFIEIKCECSDGEPARFACAFTPGDQRDVRDFIFNAGLKAASVQRFGDDYRVRTGSMAVTEPMNKLATICHLIREFEIAADTAEQIVEKAAGKPYAFRYEWPEAVKQARAIHLQAEPQFDPQIDPRFNVMLEPQPRYTIGTEYVPEPVPQQRIGDAWDPSMQTQALATATPEQLAQMAEQMQLPNIFEHGVVGQLVKTYDSSALIQKYIPKLEDALDCLGRLLFLLYWKPQDFKQIYGADDLASKESEILSSFRQFGDLVLSLVKQSRPEQSGSVVSN